MRSTFRMFLSVLLVALVLGAVAAGAAQAATEGPFYKITGTRLVEGESREVTGKNSTSYVIAWGAITITCTGQTYSGATLGGSSGANSSGGGATLTFSGCSVTGNGSGCGLEGASFKTEPLALKLAYSNINRTGRILVDFVPAKSGVFALWKFTGANCTFRTAKLVGQIAAAVSTSTGKPDEVGKEPAEEKAIRLEFPGSNNIYVEKAGTVELQAEEAELLQASGSSVRFTGASQLQLTSGASWGIYTK